VSEDTCQNNPLCPSHLYVACNDCPEKPDCRQAFSSRKERIEWELAIRRSELTWLLDNLEQRFQSTLKLLKRMPLNEWDKDKLKLEGEERVLKYLRGDISQRIRQNESAQERRGASL